MVEIARHDAETERVFKLSILKITFAVSQNNFTAAISTHE